MRTVTKLVSGWTFHTSFSSELIAKAAAGEAVRLLSQRLQPGPLRDLCASA